MSIIKLSRKLRANVGFLAMLLSASVGAENVLPTDLDVANWESPSMFFSCLGAKQLDGRVASWVALGFDYADGYRVIDFNSDFNGASDYAVLDNGLQRIVFQQVGDAQTWDIDAQGIYLGQPVKFEITVRLPEAGSKFIADYKITKSNAVYTGKNCSVFPLRPQRGFEEIDRIYRESDK